MKRMILGGLIAAACAAGGGAAVADGYDDTGAVYLAPLGQYTFLDKDRISNNRQGFQIEHRDSLVAAIRCKAVASLGGHAGAMHAWRVRNVTEHLAGGAFDYHHVGATRNEHAPRGAFDGDVVRTSVTLDIKFL